MLIVTRGQMLVSFFRGRQSTGDVNQKPSSRILLLSAKPVVTFPASVQIITAVSREQFILH